MKRAPPQLQAPYEVKWTPQANRCQVLAIAEGPQLTERPPIPGTRTTSSQVSLRSTYVAYAHFRQRRVPTEPLERCSGATLRVCTVQAPKSKANASPLLNLTMRQILRDILDEGAEVRLRHNTTQHLHTTKRCSLFVAQIVRGTPTWQGPMGFVVYICSHTRRWAL